MATPTTMRQPPSSYGAGASARQPMQGVLGSAARSSARSRSRILIGCLVALVSAFAVALLYADAGERQPVLVVARPVAAGQTIEAGDLREVLVAADGDVQMIDAAERTQVVGRTASVPLAAGSILTPDQVGDSTLLDPSDAVFGALLGEGSYPVELRAGDRVLLYVLPSGEAEDGTTEPVRATVVAVRDGLAPGSANATFSVDAGDAGAAATAAGQDRLIVVLAPR